MQAARKRAIRKELSLSTGKTVFFEYPANKPDTKTLVMIHGYRGNHRGLEAIAAGLERYRVIIPDLPGFGESDPLPTEHSVQNYCDWLSEFLERVNLKPATHLMGHSFGTLIVGQYAASYGAKSVSLVNPVSRPALEGPRAILTNLAKLYYQIAGLAPKPIGEWLLRNRMAVMVMSIAMAKTTNKRLRTWIHQQHLANFSDFRSVAVATEGYDASVSIDLSKLASSVKAPVLVIAATLDDITDISAQRDVAKQYPNATYREISDVGHLVHYEAPDLAAAFISEFLDQQ